MQNTNIKNITTEEEARKYFMSWEPDIDLMQFIDMDEVKIGVGQEEIEIANGQVIEFEEAFKMIRKEVLGEEI